MLSRSCVNAFALAVAFVLGGLLMGRPVTAQPAQQRKCVGIAAAVTTNSTYVRVYRAFEDGAVEVFQERPDAGSGKWEPVGK